MKHYADYTGTEHIAFMERNWRGAKRVQRKARSQVKTGYRRRERAALKRELAELVAEDDSAEYGAYWERKVAEHYEEYERLCGYELDVYDSGEEPSEFLLNAMRVENRLYSRAWDEMTAA